MNYKFSCFIFYWCILILQMFHIFKFWIKKAITFSEETKNKCELQISLCFLIVIIKIWSQNLIFNNSPNLGSNETITIIKSMCEYSLKIKIEFFGIIYCIKIKCICVHNLLCLLVNIKQIWVEFDFTKFLIC